MPDDSKLPQDVQDTPAPSKEESGLSQEGIKAMQGTSDQSKAEPAPTAGEAKPPTLEELAQPPYDPAKLEYRTGSPHADYQLYKDLEAADRKDELARQAATATSLPGAISTTLAAHKDSKGDDETAMDEYFYKKYGRAPYTEDAYPETEEE
jgi:hypothetical protein